MNEIKVINVSKALNSIMKHESKPVFFDKKYNYDHKMAHNRNIGL